MKRLVTLGDIEDYLQIREIDAVVEEKIYPDPLAPCVMIYYCDLTSKTVSQLYEQISNRVIVGVNVILQEEAKIERVLRPLRKKVKEFTLL